MMKLIHSILTIKKTKRSYLNNQFITSILLLQNKNLAFEGYMEKKNFIVLKLVLFFCIITISYNSLEENLYKLWKIMQSTPFFICFKHFWHFSQILEEYIV